MHPDDFTPELRHHLTLLERDTWAFSPPPLPPDIRWQADLINALASASHALGELAGLGRTLPNPYLFTRPFLDREAVLSSRIEGTRASLADLYALEVQAPLFAQPELRHDAQEVRNYVRALEHGLARLDELPISLRLLREMHHILMEGVRGQDRARGEFRRSQNWIGPPGATLQSATYVPPPPGDVLQRSLDTLERFLHAQHGLPPLITIALAHYQFEALHPFLDGNGRIGRLLITLLLIDSGLLSEPLLYLSATFERHRSDYYRLLLAVSREGAWEAWLGFFLTGVATEAKDAAHRTRTLLDLRETLRQRYQQQGASPNLLAAIDRLFAHPVLTVNALAERLELSYRGAANLVGKLEGDGVLEEVTGQKRNRVFVAQEILKLLEATSDQD